MPPNRRGHCAASMDLVTSRVTIRYLSLMFECVFWTQDSPGREAMPSFLWFGTAFLCICIITSLSGNFSGARRACRKSRLSAHYHSILSRRHLHQRHECTASTTLVTVRPHSTIVLHDMIETLQHVDFIVRALPPLLISVLAGCRRFIPPFFHCR